MEKADNYGVRWLWFVGLVLFLTLQWQIFHKEKETIYLYGPCYEFSELEDDLEAIDFESL